MTEELEHPDYDGPSKSQLKRDSHALQEMGKQLVEMPEGKLQKFDLPENLKDAIYEARRLKSREAKRRHLQYIGKLMRISNTDVIQETLDMMDHQSQTYRQHFKQLEDWRDRIIQEGNGGIEAFIDAYPEGDRQQLRNLQRQANREVELKKAPTASRKIFSYIRSLAE
ncbi:MAG: ribosome biogenesis factor YjgA [Porticoccaceae bacterium]|jgi:ribosome-associated protein|nr:ribosome biogenesis factor YjgA [Porticoccaceae bacterium]